MRNGGREGTVEDADDTNVAMQCSKVVGRGDSSDACSDSQPDACDDTSGSRRPPFHVHPSVSTCSPQQFSIPTSNSQQPTSHFTSPTGQQLPPAQHSNLQPLTFDFSLPHPHLDFHPPSALQSDPPDVLPPTCTPTCRHPASIVDLTLPPARHSDFQPPTVQYDIHILASSLRLLYTPSSSHQHPTSRAHSHLQTPSSHHRPRISTRPAL